MSRGQSRNINVILEGIWRLSDIVTERMIRINLKKENFTWIGEGTSKNDKFKVRLKVAGLS